MRMTSEPPMCYRLNNHDRAFTGAQQILLRISIFTALLLLLTVQLSAQSAAPTQSAPDQQTAQPGQKDSALKPSPPAKPKKVITNDDLKPKSTGSGQSGSPLYISTGDSGPLLECGASCEQQAREELGYGADREAEWQMQIVKARRDLASDTAWQATLRQAIEQTNRYCNLLAQRSQRVSPSGDSFNAQVQRAQAERYFQEMDRTLRQGLDSVAGGMNNRIREVNELSPVRAAMMHVEASRILDRECEYPDQQ